MSDLRIRAIAADSEIQITAVTSTETVERARQIHRTMPTATAALGRALTICSIMGSQLKVDDGSVTVQFKGNGPLGSVVCVSDSGGNVRGYLQNPACDLPLRSDGKLNVGAGIGRGYLMVIKDIGLKDPVSGTTVLVNGEIAEDITRYFAESEQIPSACALGVLVDTDQSVKQAGGYLVQLMPGCPDADIDRLEQNIQKAGSMTAMLDAGMTLQDIIYAILDGFKVEFLQESTFKYQCNCSRDKVTRALISMGREELGKLAAEEENLEITCQFCDRIYEFTNAEIKNILEKV
ncbi:MAG: Hsp33 family molecular chaperone HslO [Clostridiaceae bacterium]|nr:Hsp33 family molecular chaperone HslO [Clostridiaceae bacterium]